MFEDLLFGGRRKMLVFFILSWKTEREELKEVVKIKIKIKIKIADVGSPPGLPTLRTSIFVEEANEVSWARGTAYSRDYFLVSLAIK